MGVGGGRVVVLVGVAALLGAAVVLGSPDLLQQTHHDMDVPALGGREPRLSPVVASKSEAPQGVGQDDDDPLDDRTAHWAGAMYDLLQAMTCTNPAWTSEDTCRQVQQVSKGAMQVWATRAGMRYVARLPDGSLRRLGPHDGVLMLDPFPGASWGHLVLVALVQANTSTTACTNLKGHWLEPGDCLTVAVKERCRNLLERRGRRRNYSRRCEINFPPLVVTEEEDARIDTHHVLREAPTQMLKCRGDAKGYAACPQLRPRNDTEQLVCDPLGVNSKRCSPTHETVHTRCRLFEICDQAVVVSGGWSRDVSPRSSQVKVKQVYNMLRHNGFHKANIKLFYANGAKKNSDPSLRHAVYPSSMKLGLRYHLRSLCAAPLCTDSLLLYLTGPTLYDGTLVLWDQDRNGLVRGGEVYTPRELLSDVRECRARQLTILVDTSYSGELVRAFNASKEHKNVQVYAVGGSEDYAWGSEFSQHWLHYAHTHACTHQAYQASLSGIHLSTPSTFDGSGGELRRTIFGAPCDVNPPFSWRELHHSYYGCQNTPTALWLRAMPSLFTPPALKDITDQFSSYDTLDR